MCFGIAFVIPRKSLMLVLEDHHLHCSRLRQNSRRKITISENSPSARRRRNAGASSRSPRRTLLRLIVDDELDQWFWLPPSCQDTVTK